MSKRKGGQNYSGAQLFKGPRMTYVCTIRPSEIITSAETVIVPIYEYWRIGRGPNLMHDSGPNERRAGPSCAGAELLNLWHVWLTKRIVWIIECCVATMHKRWSWKSNRAGRSRMRMRSKYLNLSHWLGHRAYLYGIQNKMWRNAVRRVCRQLQTELKNDVIRFIAPSSIS
jgi:hypothetical protein